MNFGRICRLQALCMVHGCLLVDICAVCGDSTSPAVLMLMFIGLWLFLGVMWPIGRWVMYSQFVV